MVLLVIRNNFKGARCILHMLVNYPTYFDTPHVISSGSLCGCYHNAFEMVRFVFKHFMYVKWNLRVCASNLMHLLCNGPFDSVMVAPAWQVWCEQTCTIDV